MPRVRARRKRVTTNSYVPIQVAKKAKQGPGPKRRPGQTRSCGRPSSPILAASVSTVQSDTHPEIDPPTEEHTTTTLSEFNFDPQSHFDSLSQSLIDFGQQSIEDVMLWMEQRIEERLDSRLGPSTHQPRDEMPTTIGSPQSTDHDLQRRAISGNYDVITKTINVGSHLDSRTRNTICHR